ERLFMPTTDVTVFYLEMHAHAQRIVPLPQQALSVIHAKKPTISYYRYLYDAVGRDYHWYSKARLSDEALSAIIHDPLVEIHVFHVDGTPAGFAELDRRVKDDIEMVQFGLMRDFIGQGLGRYFLQRAIDQAWSYRPRRLWLHTCTLDH